MIPPHSDPTESTPTKEPGGVGELQKVLECDDGIFNIDWWQYSKYQRGTCQWPLTRCDDKASYWCVHCGGLTCERHRKNHAAGKWHNDRMMDLREPITDE